MTPTCTCTCIRVYQIYLYVYINSYIHSDLEIVCDTCEHTEDGKASLRRAASGETLVWAPIDADVQTFSNTPPLVHVRTLPFFLFFSLFLLLPTLDLAPPCVDSKRLRVYRHHAHMFYTCGRGASSHGDVLNAHTGVFQRVTPHTTTTLKTKKL